jgi:hypothetical protein
MPYSATVFSVMLASPSDVIQIKSAADEVIRDWNAAHSRATSIMLLPIDWAIHSSPAMGERPQEIINQQVLENADVLVGIFWTRLGTPTGEYASGTVEEIEKHIQAQKPTMLYFSSIPVSPESVDTDQLLSLRKFRDKMKDEGRLEFFDNEMDFRSKFSRQLALVMNTNTYITDNLPTDQPSESPFVKERLRISLSELASDILLNAAKDPNGLVMFLDISSGLIIKTNGKSFVGNTPRIRAELDAAINELKEFDFLMPKGYEGKAFTITQKGFEFVDQMQKTKL